MKTDILIIGNGGREDAIGQKLLGSDGAGRIYCLPGNGGISEYAEIPDIPSSPKKITAFVKEKNIDFVVIGPEQPLAEGFADMLRAEGIKTFGPGRRGAKLESSKVFAKEFMKRNNVPTAPFEVFSDMASAKDYLKKLPCPVIKADGLCGGKGVYVCSSPDEASAALDTVMKQRKFKNAGDRVLIEEKLSGEELSVLLLLSLNNYSLMLPAQDHKSVFEGDRGPNTGGMGAYAPSTAAGKTMMKKIEKDIVEKIIEGLKKENIKYSGVLYIGLMISEGTPRVLEFNVRFGDPETEALLPLLESDLLEALLKTEADRPVKLKWKEEVCADVVLASDGYPGSYDTGKKIHIKKEKMPEGVHIFHAGTELKEGGLYTSGGRVINVAACGKDIVSAREKAYSAVNCIEFENIYYRKDIGYREVKRYERNR